MQYITGFVWSEMDCEQAIYCLPIWFLGLTENISLHVLTRKPNFVEGKALVRRYKVKAIGRVQMSSNRNIHEKHEVFGWNNSTAHACADSWQKCRFYKNEKVLLILNTEFLTKKTPTNYAKKRNNEVLNKDEIET